MLKPKMTGDQQKAVKRLVKGLCVNYDRFTGDCLLLDETCWQMCATAGFCRYFKESVLPADKALYAELVEPESFKVCECGRRYVPRSNRSCRCPECAKLERRKKEAARLRRLRAG